MRLIICGALLAALSSGFALADDRERPRFEFDLREGTINGPGSRFLTGDFDRRIGGIEDGRRSSIAARWNIDESWFVLARYEKAHLEYPNPRDIPCPLTPDWFFGRTYCQTSLGRRQGEIYDKTYLGQLEVGFRETFGDRVDVLFSLGYGRLRWHSPGDIEARATADCLAFGQYQTSPSNFHIPGCTAVPRQATAAGLIASLGAEVQILPRLSGTLTVNHQSFRHWPYRNDVITRFRDRNCRTETCFREATSGQYINPIDGNRWEWVSLELAYDFSKNWAATLNIETAGNRDWDVVDLGLRFSF